MTARNPSKQKTFKDRVSAQALKTTSCTAAGTSGSDVHRSKIVSSLACYTHEKEYNYRLVTIPVRGSHFPIANNLLRVF
jgi:hypothetical protein